MARYFAINAPHLENLVFSDCRIGETSAILLAETLVQEGLAFPYLISLNFSENPLRGGVIPLFLFFSQNSFALRKVHLQTTKINGGIALSLAQRLTLEDVFLPALTYLDISDNPLGEGIVPLLVFFAKHAPHLEELNLDGVDLMEEGLNELIERFFTQNIAFPSLRYLSMGDNLLGASGITFVQALSHIAPQVESLNLYRIGLRSEYARGLIETEYLSPLLREVDLSGNPIRAISGSLESFFNSTGRTVHLLGTWDIGE